MTDLEKFIDTYKQFGIEVNTFNNSKGNIEIILSGFLMFDEEINPTISNKFNGFGFSNLEFTKNGKFIQQGFWEL